MVWNAVASIGGSLISGIFGSKKKKEETITDQTSSSTIDYKGLADAAIAGGFNPLTAIRTGGASGFVTTRTTGKNVTTSSGGGGVGAAIGDAIASAGSLFGSYTQPKNDPIKVKSKTTGAVSSLVRSQLPGSSRAPALNVQPVHRTQRSPVSTTRTAPEKGNKPGEGKLVGGDDPTVSSMGWNDGRYGLFHAPWMPDAEIVETIYGDNEINSLLYSINKYGNDLGYSAWRNYQSAKSDLTDPKGPLRQHLRDKIRENNYREMSRRGVVNNRPRPPAGYRYAN